MSHQAIINKQTIEYFFLFLRVQKVLKIVHETLEL